MYQDVGYTHWDTKSPSSRWAAFTNVPPYRNPCPDDIKDSIAALMFI